MKAIYAFLLPKNLFTVYHIHACIRRIEFKVDPVLSNSQLLPAQMGK